MVGLRNPAPPQTDSNASAGINNSNRFVVLYDSEQETESEATTDVVPVGEIADASQDGDVAAHAVSNKAIGDVQGQVAEPEVEGGVVPQEEDPQPDGVVSSNEADFHKAEPEQDLPLVQRPPICLKTQKGEFQVPNPTKKKKSVVPLEAMDQHSNDKLECNVGNVATSAPKKNWKSKHGPNKMHASKHAIKQSKRGTLVDQGANGRTLGNDPKVIFKSNKTADVTGVDNHEITALPMVNGLVVTRVCHNDKTCSPCDQSCQ